MSRRHARNVDEHGPRTTGNCRNAARDSRRPATDHRAALGATLTRRRATHKIRRKSCRIGGTSAPGAAASAQRYADRRPGHPCLRCGDCVSRAAILLWCPAKHGCLPACDEEGWRRSSRGGQVRSSGRSCRISFTRSMSQTVSIRRRARNLPRTGTSRSLHFATRSWRDIGLVALPRTAMV